MGTSFKIWRWYMGNAVRNWKLLISILVCGIAFNILISAVSGTFSFLVIIAIPILSAVLLMLSGVYYVVSSGKYMKIYAEKGFCREMCEEFEKRFIRGKNPDISHRLTYAEIQIRIGDAERGKFLLDQMNISEMNTLNRAIYISLYMYAVMAINDPALARDVWQSNSEFIGNIINKNILEVNAAALRLKQIGITALEGNYTGALDIIGECYDSVRKFKEAGIDILNWQIYIYHMFGSLENEEKAIRYAEKELAETKFEFEGVRICALKDFENAKNGIPPV